MAPEFHRAGGRFLLHVLARMGKHYQEDVTRCLPPMLRAYWTGSISRDRAIGEDLKESQEVLAEARTELRAERLALVESWMREYELAEARDPWQVEISRRRSGTNSSRC